MDATRQPETARNDKEFLAAGRLSRVHVTDAARAAVLVLDQVQHQGLGTEIMRRTGSGCAPKA